MIAGPAIVSTVSIEAFAISAGTIGLEISAAPHASAHALSQAGRARRPIVIGHVARLTRCVTTSVTTRFSARIATRFRARLGATLTTLMRIYGSAAGSSQYRQREHGKRAFHVSPLMTWATGGAHEKRAKRRS